MSGNEKNKKWFIVMAIVLVCFAFAGAARAGTGWIEKQKLLASDGATWDNFGYSVSISGDFAILGAICDDDKGYNSGSAYIFKWNGTNWVEQQKLLASDGAADDQFGQSVSINGDYAIVGAESDDNKGSAYIFKRDGATWIQQAKLTASDGAGGDGFGISVSISGGYAIVGAGWNGYNGSAYIFRWDGAGWSEQQKLAASDGAAWDCFGISVSINGDYAIVGAESDDSGKGSAYIFRWDGVGWSEQQKLAASDGAGWDYFGISVSISGDYAIVGAGGDDGYKGSAYIFKRDGVGWSQQQKLLASDGAASDQFGQSVSISGDYAIVGAGGDDDKGDGSGSAYIFKRDGVGWVEQAKLTASDGAGSDHFGNSVSISGDYAIVGAIFGDGNVTDSGSAYIFVPCASWLTADLNGDCVVDFKDFGIFANQWLKCGDTADPNCHL